MNVIITVWALIGGSALLSVWFLLRYCWQGPSLAKTVIKTGSVAGLALAALLLGGVSWLFAALALAALGDFFLSRAGDRAFLAGLVSFALAHLAYVALMLETGASMDVNLFTVLVALVSVAMVFVLFPRAGALRWPVAGYVAIIAAMGMIAVSLPMSFVVAMFAAALFMASDIVLGLERFVWPPAHRMARVAPFFVWTTYWGAQLLFLFAFAIERSL
ncbi:lysoplasmalogenase family protein [Yoonia litorea]|uniref:Uncharacterized membrane protein YhhN n=1 Tax=Yoonia litorea TaxID=1123755 RepID=A0A1I6LMC2_9RHOB|nr:lysoplasmalogenase family protein [Yoonia litorea]SFS04528.1 Uncharacterized membrane protein YhhN [Yoonia litorea]